MVRGVKQKVFVAMSGGVDSSVAAVLLKKQGYDITGVFIKIEVTDDCGWREERRDAMRVAAKLKVPLLTFDLSQEYRQSVIDYLFKEYRAGRTPNPDVMCNKEIKFGAFFKQARRLGADYIATGHYARRSKTNLLVAKDKQKDQTYFLWTMTPEVLSHCLFPIGQYQKSAVRVMAKKFGLPNATKPDSQGLCFIGQIDFKDFLRQYLPAAPGPVLSEAGRGIGHHHGNHFYTIGERHGFTIHQSTPAESPYYIVAKDSSQNALIAAPRERVADWSVKEVELTNANWISVRPSMKGSYQARARYRAPLDSCRLAFSSGDKIKVVFDQSLTGVAPGQSCAIYDHGVCLGGGGI